MEGHYKAIVNDTYDFKISKKEFKSPKPELSN